VNITTVMLAMVYDVLTSDLQLISLQWTLINHHFYFQFFRHAIFADTYCFLKSSTLHTSPTLKNIFMETIQCYSTVCGIMLWLLVCLSQNSRATVTSK